LLGSAYLLGGTADHLNDVYENVAATDGLEPWHDSPAEIALHDYRDYLGKREYQRAFVDFFEDQVVLSGYDWKFVVEKFLFDRTKKSAPNPLPMFDCLTAGLGHPLIHLGYAYELDSREVAMEALGLAATCYSPRLAGLLETPSTTTTTTTTNNLFELFARVQADTRLDSAFDHIGPDGDKLTHLLDDPTLSSILLEHWSAWKIEDPKADFARSQALAAALLVSAASAPAPAPTPAPTSSSSVSPGNHGYDFFLVHLLTTSHAVRILIPLLPPQHHLTLVREWLLFTLAVYITQSRPVIKKDHVTDYDLNGRGWDFVTKTALEGKHRFDAHFVKACRALREAGRTWGDDDHYYLKAAVRLAAEFDGWVFDQEVN
jgi:hypothetical protein